MRWRAPSVIGDQIDRLRTEARHHEATGEAGAAWGCLSDAHVLSQPWAATDVGVHADMAGLGWRSGSAREVVGQVFRIAVAAPASVAGRYPTGNSGRSGVSAFATAPVRDDLAALLVAAEVEEAGSAVLDVGEVRSMYDRMAPFYDVASRPYGWFGTGRLAERAIDELRLQAGDTVVELGTGTGRNLAALSAAVGPEGRVVGVDLSPGMLAVARGKADEAGLGNVEFVEADMSLYDLPGETDAVVSTYAIEMLADYDELIARLAAQVRPGGRIVVNGLRSPDRWPEWVTRLGSWLSRPFGVSDAYRSHRPWESVERHTGDVAYDEAMAGAAYLAAGTAAGPRETT